MRIKNCKKLGISMVALVITIIVLIVMAAAVVITGVGAPKQAQLATFYSNIDTVQDLVSLEMGNNMIEGAVRGYGENYKWVGIATKIKDGTKSTYTVEDAINNEPINFERTVDGLDREVVQISEEFIRNQTSLPIEEGTKYYTDQQGSVYHQGVVIDGKTYYNKDTITDNSTQQGENELEGISAAEVAANPMSYYGAYVNYTDINGEMYTMQSSGTEEYPNDLEWRIFYSDGNNIYLTTKYIVDYGSWYSREDAIGDLTEEKSTYVNEFYAEWSKDGIDYEMFKTSYNQVNGDHPDQNIPGNKDDGYSAMEMVTDERNLVSEVASLDGIQEDLYNFGSYAYVLASISSDYSSNMMYVNCEESYVQGMYYNDYYTGIRPIVCLKADVRLVENNGRYDLNGGPIVTNETRPVGNTIKIRAVDDNGIIGYAVTRDNVKPTSFTSCASTKSLTQVVGGMNQNTTYYVWVKDIDGNISEGKQVKTGQVVTASEVFAHPELYYGAYVNYTDINGEPYIETYLSAISPEYPTEIEWRIFYSDGQNLYLTTKMPVQFVDWNSRGDALNDLISESNTYKNGMYAEWSKNGITYDMFRSSYNAIAQARGIELQSLAGSESKGYTVSDNGISRLSGTLQEALYTSYYYGDFVYYWLASMSADNWDNVLYVYERWGSGHIYEKSFEECHERYYNTALRPLVCLNANVQLGENNGEYDLLVDTRPVVTNETSMTSYSITIEAIDDSGIIGYAVTNDNVQPTNFTSCPSTMSLTQIVGGMNQNTTYYVWVKDTDGNVSVGKQVKTSRRLTEGSAISTTEKYVGYYADIEGDGTVDGVIYADLLVGASGQWRDTDEYSERVYEYTMNTINSAKPYYISQESYTDDYFGTHPVITPMGVGEERFYIMALSDISTDSYCWYYNADDIYIENNNTITKKDFGEGRRNTSNMLTAWNNEVYGVQTAGDMWAAIAYKVAEGWFVPSIEEWLVFEIEFNVDSTNYSSMYGLSSMYWSSSLDDLGGVAWYISFYNYFSYLGHSFMSYYDLDYTGYVRLSTTF